MPDRISRRGVLQALGATGALSLGRAAVGFDEPPQTSPLGQVEAKIRAGEHLRWKGSPLGNQYPLLKRIKEESPKSLAYLKVRPIDLEAWKHEARGKIFELMHYQPKPCDPQAQILEKADKGDYIREYLRFHTTPDIEVSAYFLYPKSTKFPVPGVVALHDHGGFYYFGKEKILEIENENPILTKYRGDYYAGLSYPITLARNGYAVIIIDMFYFGERRLILDSDLEQGTNDWSKKEGPEAIARINTRNGQLECWVDRNVQHAGITWGGLLCWDDIRTVDYLETRPEVDAKRIACVGLSVGGWRTNFLAGLDSRIKASCVAGWMTSFDPFVPWFVSYSIPAGNLPGMYDYLDYPDIGSMTMPSPMMVVHGTWDALFPPEGVEEAFRNLTGCYQAIGKPERFTTFSFPGPHSFPARAQQLMLDWFSRWV